ncbi:uncharacterized protein LOC143253919 isoform X2 [Tachypleus tridentatus]
MQATRQILKTLFYPLGSDNELPKDRIARWSHYFFMGNSHPKHAHRSKGFYYSVGEHPHHNPHQRNAYQSSHGGFVQQLYEPLRPPQVARQTPINLERNYNNYKPQENTQTREEEPFDTEVFLPNAPFPPTIPEEKKRSGELFSPVTDVTANSPNFPKKDIFPSSSIPARFSSPYSPFERPQFPIQQVLNENQPPVQFMLNLRPHIRRIPNKTDPLEENVQYHGETSVPLQSPHFQNDIPQAYPEYNLHPQHSSTFQEYGPAGNTRNIEGEYVQSPVRKVTIPIQPTLPQEYLHGSFPSHESTSENIGSTGGIFQLHFDPQIVLDFSTNTTPSSAVQDNQENTYFHPDSIYLSRQPPHSINIYNTFTGEPVPPKVSPPYDSKAHSPYSYQQHPHPWKSVPDGSVKPHVASFDTPQKKPPADISEAYIIFPSSNSSKTDQTPTPIKIKENITSQTVKGSEKKVELSFKSNITSKDVQSFNLTTEITSFTNKDKKELENISAEKNTTANTKEEKQDIIVKQTFPTLNTTEEATETEISITDVLKDQKNFRIKSTVLATTTIETKENENDNFIEATTEETTKGQNDLIDFNIEKEEIQLGTPFSVTTVSGITELKEQFPKETTTKLITSTETIEKQEEASRELKTTEETTVKLDNMSEKTSSAITTTIGELETEQNLATSTAATEITNTITSENATITTTTGVTQKLEEVSPSSPNTGYIATTVFPTKNATFTSTFEGTKERDSLSTERSEVITPHENSTYISFETFSEKESEYNFETNYTDNKNITQGKVSIETYSSSTNTTGNVTKHSEEHNIENIILTDKPVDETSTTENVATSENSKEQPTVDSTVTSNTTQTSISFETFNEKVSEYNFETNFTDNKNITQGKVSIETYSSSTNTTGNVTKHSEEHNIENIILTDKPVDETSTTENVATSENSKEQPTVDSTVTSNTTQTSISFETFNEKVSEYNFETNFTDNKNITQGKVSVETYSSSTNTTGNVTKHSEEHNTENIILTDKPVDEANIKVNVVQPKVTEKEALSDWEISNHAGREREEISSRTNNTNKKLEHLESTASTVSPTLVSEKVRDNKESKLENNKNEKSEGKRTERILFGFIFREKRHV